MQKSRPPKICRLMFMDKLCDKKILKFNQFQLTDPQELETTVLPVNLFTDTLTLGMQCCTSLCICTHLGERALKHAPFYPPASQPVSRRLTKEEEIKLLQSSGFGLPLFYILTCCHAELTNKSRNKICRKRNAVTFCQVFMKTICI